MFFGLIFFSIGGNFIIVFFLDATLEKSSDCIAFCSSAVVGNFLATLELIFVIGIAASGALVLDNGIKEAEAFA